MEDHICHGSKIEGFVKLIAIFIYSYAVVVVLCFEYSQRKMIQGPQQINALIQLPFTFVCVFTEVQNCEMRRFGRFMNYIA